MKNKDILWIILKSIFLILFNVAFFVLGGANHNVSVWISYGFIHFAYFMLLLTPKLIRCKKSWMELGFPLYIVSATYFLVEFFVGVFFMLIFLNGYKASLLIQLSIAGLYGVIIIAHLIANEWTTDAEEEQQCQIAFVKDASAKIRWLLESINDKEVKRKVERVYDLLCSSPVKSHPDLALVENRILQSIRVLEDVICAGNKESIIAQAGILEAVINERNGRLKTYN